MLQLQSMAKIFNAFRAMGWNEEETALYCNYKAWERSNTILMILMDWEEENV